MVSTITHTDTLGRTVTLPVGRANYIGREGACLDICLTRALAIDCPLTVSILIRTTGEIVLWNTAWGNSSNTYWHFGGGSDEDARKRRPTAGQLATLERMFLRLADMPGGIDAALGRPVATWAFEGQTADSIAAKHGVRTPALA